MRFIATAIYLINQLMLWYSISFEIHTLIPPAHVRTVKLRLTGSPYSARESVKIAPQLVLTNITSTWL